MLAELFTLVMLVALLISKPHIALLLSVAVALQGLEELLGHVLLYLLPIRGCILFFFLCLKSVEM